jgi:hypothetical protein
VTALSEDELPRSLAKLAYEGSALAGTFADGAQPAPTSTLEMLNSVTAHTWGPADVDFLARTIRALTAIGGAQLRGAGHVLMAEPSIQLHPLVTLLRGIAEASGMIWWLNAPLLPRVDEAVDIQPAEWLARGTRVVTRSQLHHLDELAQRRARREASHRQGSEEYRQVVKQADALKQHFINLHGAGASFSGGRKAWRIGQETLPQKTDLVIAVTEYAYGERYRGSGINPYRLYSGYAHASVELVFAHATETMTSQMSTLIVAEEDEVQAIAGAALRTFAVGYEFASHMFGLDLTALREWEGRVDPLIIDTSQNRPVADDQ